MPSYDWNRTMLNISEISYAWHLFILHMFATDKSIVLFSLLLIVYLSDATNTECD
jgi:hypothetical protein